MWPGTKRSVQKLVEEHYSCLYRYAYRLPSAKISLVQEAHAQACEKLGLDRCRITGMRYRLVNQKDIEAMLALQRQGAREGDVEDEGRHAQEDERQDEAQGLQLRQLVLQRPVRQLQRARDRAEPAVGFEQPIELDHDGVGRGAG